MPPDNASPAAGEEESTLHSDNFAMFIYDYGEGGTTGEEFDFLPHLATDEEIIDKSVLNASNLPEVVAERSPKLRAAIIESSSSLFEPPNPPKLHKPVNGGSQNPTGLVDYSVSSGSRSSNMPAA
jgi:hypothetical protein